LILSKFTHTFYRLYDHGSTKGYAWSSPHCRRSHSFFG